jgi:putative ABC transport system substrate-binding protein
MAALGGALAWPVAAQAQQQGMPVIGFAAGSLKLSAIFLENVRRGLAKLGYVEGQNYRFDIRETNFKNDLLPSLYRELVEQKVTLIVTATTLQLERAKAATQSIPIVFTIGIDPVENGFVASLNKPSGNITGVFNLTVMVTAKRLEVLHELVPSATKFAFLTDPGNITLGKLQIAQIEALADSFGLGILNVNARTPDELEAAFEICARGGASGMIVGADALFLTAYTELVQLADRYRFPVIYEDDLPVIAGGLISYGTDTNETQRLVGNLAGRILKGEKPADIPVQQASKTRFVINLKTAKALGITVPTPLLGRADEVIE